MENRTVQILLVLLISFVAMSFLYGAITGMFVGFGPPTNATWWNVSWHYRLTLDINSSIYSRTDWPIEHVINFTDNVPSGTFDINSARLIEYDSSGSILYEVPSQFDPGDNYDAATNAVGELIFILNGTTSANANRTFYLYYDTIEFGAKQPAGYIENINYSTGKSFSINNTYLSIFIDTNRGANVSGMHRVQDIYENVIFYSGSSANTAEYLEYSNYTQNLTFDLIDNYSFTNGTARVTIEQIGNEVLFGDPSQQTNEAYVNKKYYVYYRAGPQQYGSFIKIKQTVTNSAGYSIQRNSTLSGALAFDADRTLNSGSVDSEDVDTQNPFSWVWASGVGGDTVAFLQLSQSGTSNYYALNNSFSGLGRIGINLNETTINAGSSIEQTTLVYFSGTGGSDAVTEFYNIRDRFENPINISQSLPERWYVITNVSTNSTTYNRNETMLIGGNVSDSDPYGFTEYMNATIDMGTADTGDDQTIILYDDGAHDDYGADDDFYANTFVIPNNDNVTVWTVNVTTYDNYSMFLNSTSYSFNVTDVFSVNVTVIDKKPIADALVRANITVQNYMETTGIAGATINCSFDSTEITNKTDHGGGNYSVNFSAPSSEGGYVLTCNATLNNNTGTGNDTFTVESSKVNVTIDTVPTDVNITNITLYQNETFELATNFTTVGNGTAYSVNVTIELPTNWVSVPATESCGDIEEGYYCTRNFNITVPENTSASLYYVNVSIEWGNPDNTNSSNQTSVNVNVTDNPQINLTTTSLVVEGADGTNIHVDNFTLQSIGNSILQNITFDCYQDTVCTDFNVSFTPNNISSLDINYNQSIAVNISIPMAYTPGNYSGYINVSAENDNYKILELNVSVPQSTTLNITFQPPSYTAYTVTMKNGENFTMNVTLDNIENGSARYSNMSLVIPENWSITSSFENCDNITANEVCIRTFNVSIPNGTSSGNYLINVTANWTNGNNSLGINTISFLVNVANVPLIDVFETGVSGTVGDGEEQTLGNFTVLSIGNGMLQNISFDCYQGDVCNNFNPEFQPINISTLDIGQNQSIAVNISIPLGFIVGNYTGSINVSAENDNNTIIDINVTVPSNRTWNLSTTFCQKSEFPDVGTACEVIVFNQGNDNISINITPQQGNYTEVNITAFYVTAGSNYTFNVTYNVTNVTQAPYNSTFLVDALDSNANPDNMTLVVSLLPYQPPIINFTILPNETEQNETVIVLVNITDMSTSGIKWANVTVDTPGGLSNTSNLTLYNSSGDFYQYTFSYPNGVGDTSVKGTYNVTITSEDNIGNLGNKTKIFSIYTNLIVISGTLADTYLQGDSGSIYYSVKNVSGIGMSGVNVSFLIYDATNNISYYSAHQAGADGYIVPLPTFSISSDAVTGNYTLVTNSTYYDSDVGQTIEKQTNSSFNVQQRTVTVMGLFAEVETSVIWYPNNEMRFAFLIYNGEGRPVDPDSMNLTIFDPSEEVYRTATMDSTWYRTTGYYVYDFIMPPTTVNGMYMAVVNVSQGSFFTSEIKVFRVAQGGPYDVRVTPFEFEVGQGDYFDFEIVVENKGTVSQDVFIEYNVTDLNRTTTYYYASEAVYTPATSNQSFTRNAYVFSNQPLGMYLLTAKVTFDYIQPPIIANTTFQVIEGLEPYEPPPPPPPPPPTGLQLVEQPEEEIVASLLIVGYNSNVSLARGFSRIESVTVKNDGRTKLRNISLYVLGIPTEWFLVTPESYESLDVDGVATFLIEYNVPENAIPSQYKANLLATSGVISDQKAITITIFESIKELLEKEIKKIKEELVELKVDTRLAEKEGKDVSNVLLFINMTESYISGAEDDIENNRPEDAMDKISNAVGLIKKARDILDALEFPEVPPLFIPLWMILILFVIVIVIIFVIVFWKRKKLKPMMRPYIANLSRTVERIRGKPPSKESLEKEKERLSRMLNVLEKEKQEGIISVSAYEKMKKSIENKKKRIENKIK